MFSILFVLLALDCAAVFDGDLTNQGGALVALILAIIGVVLIVLERRP